MEITNPDDLLSIIGNVSWQKLSILQMRAVDLAIMYEKEDEPELSESCMGIADLITATRAVRIIEDRNAPASSLKWALSYIKKYKEETLLDSFNLPGIE